MLLLLGIGSSLCWGTADFFGGLQSRRIPSLAVALWSQLAGGVVLLAVLAAGHTTPTPPTIAWGVFGGLFGGAALALFYRGLAVGTMSIVAPVSACGAIVPVLLTLATGHIPRVLALVGIIVAIGGVILVSLQREAAPHDARRARQSLLVALVALNRGVAPWPGRRTAPVAGVGILDMTANVLFAYATTRGNAGVVAVLGSLYPVMTVILGRFVLAERLSQVQNIGVVVALAGVVLLSAG
ncbi:MAG: DMT family transporter [Chloroflexi bacterium]|nr:DMT family transporter [Chloroflexota bacterium]